MYETPTTANCTGCGRQIVLRPRTRSWVHPVSGLSDCNPGKAFGPQATPISGSIVDGKVADRAKKALREAADLIEKQGHLAKGANVDTSGCYCTIGAVAKATRFYAKYTPTDWAAHEVAVQRLASVIEYPAVPDRDGGTKITSWNDQFDRTQAESVAALRKAAAL